MHRLSIATCAIALATAASLVATESPQSGALERIRQSGRIRFGYRNDARPFSYRDEYGNAAGYSIALCRRIADATMADLGLPKLAVEWIPVTAEERFLAVNLGKIDLLCGADTVTLERQRSVAFSTPIFPGGIGALLRSDAPAPLRNVLSGRQTFHPTWRASASRLVQARAFSAVAGTTAATWLPLRIDELQVLTTLQTASSYQAGVDAVLSRRVDALFGERAIVLDAARRQEGGRDLIVLDRQFTYEPLAFPLVPRDEPFRLLVDRTLTQFYASGKIRPLYTAWFGAPDQSAVTFFRWNTLPD